MQYVFNPRNNQINPALEMTFLDPTLRDKVVSEELYALVCHGKVSIADIAAMFAVGKSPEILLKNHAAVKDSPIAKAPAATAQVKEEVTAPLPPGPSGVETDEAPATADGAFDGKSLCEKKQDELLILASTVKCPELDDPNFAPTPQNLIKAIMAKAAAAEAGAAPATPRRYKTVR